MTELTIDNTKLLESQMDVYDILLQLNVLRKAYHKNDEVYINTINEVVYSMFTAALQIQQTIIEKEGNNISHRDYDNYKKEITESVQKEIIHLQKEHPEVILNVPTSFFERIVREILEDEHVMDIVKIQWANAVIMKDAAESVINNEDTEADSVGIAGGVQPVVGVQPVNSIPISGMPMGGIPTNGMFGQFPQNMNTYPQNQNQNQEATVVPQDTPEGQKIMDEIDKQTNGQFKKKLKSITKNGIHPQVALVATNAGALLVGMLIPGASFLVMTATLKANLEILPKWPKKKLVPVTENWFEDPEMNNPDKDNPDKNDPDKPDKDNPDNPQQKNQQMPQNGMIPNGIIPNGMMYPYGAPNGMMGGTGVVPQNGTVGAVPQGGGVGAGTVTSPIWEAVASQMAGANGIKTVTKATYYVDKDGKLYINAKECHIDSDVEYIELNKDNLQKYLTEIAQKNGLGEAESVKEFIEQISNIAKGNIGIKEINSGLATTIKASTKLNEMMKDNKLSDYGKEIYNELLSKKIQNLVEFDPEKPIEKEIIEELEETRKILTEKLTQENLEKLNKEEKEQFTQMLSGLENTLNMIKIYQGVKLIEEKEQEIGLLKDKKKLKDLRVEMDNINKEEKNLEDDNINIQKGKIILDEEIKKIKAEENINKEPLNVESLQKNYELLQKRKEYLQRSIKNEKTELNDAIKSNNDDEKKRIQNNLDYYEQDLKNTEQELEVINNKLQPNQQKLDELNQQKQTLETREKENNEKLTTITKRKKEIDAEIKKYEDVVKKKQTNIENEIEQSKKEKLNKLQQEREAVEKLKKEKEKIKKSKKELDEQIQQHEREIKESNDKKDKSANVQKTDENIKEIYNNKIKEKDNTVKKINERQNLIKEYKKEKEKLEKKFLKKQENKQRIEDLQKKIDKLENETKEFKNSMKSIDTEIKNTKLQVELVELKEKKQQKEKEAEHNKEELQNSRTVEDINKDITVIENKYKNKMNNLADIDSIEDKEKEVKNMKEEISQQKQNYMSQDLILIQQQMLQESRFAGLDKVLKIESVDMPQYQAPVISVGQGKAHDAEIGNNI